MKEPEPIACPKHCFHGHHGMDNCNTCGTTGSVFFVNGKYFPNTEEGFNAAVKEQENETPSS